MVRKDKESVKRGKQITREMLGGIVDIPQNCWNKSERGDTREMDGRKIMVAGKTKSAVVEQLRKLVEDVEQGVPFRNMADADGIRMMRTLNERERKFYLEEGELP